MKKTVHILTTVLLLAITIPSAIAGGGGGGSCTFSDAAGAGTSLSSGTVYSMDNTGCDATACCENPAVSCCGSSSCTYDECYYTLMGALYSVSSCFCGSPENTMYATFCPSTTTNYTFTVSSISCSGGAASLQWGITPTTGYSCSGGYTLFCEGGTTANQSTTESLTAGQCYKLFFDGNAGAACTWTFTISPILPLTVNQFTVTKSNLSNIIKWDINGTENVAKLVLERSEDNVNFEGIKEYTNVSAKSEFNYEDRNPYKVSYYRLKQTDNSGKVEYSSTVSSIMEVKYEVKNVYSTDKKIQVNYTAEKTEALSISVYDVTGKMIKSQDVNPVFGNNIHTIDMAGNKTGAYFVVVENDKDRTVKKVVVN